MRKLLVALLLLAVLIVAAALAAPSLVDRTRLKSDLAGRLASLTGRVVTIDGDLGFQLLPTPSLSVDGVHIAAPPGATIPDTLAVSELDAQVALLPLLTGTIRVERVTLVRPVLALERPAQGRPTWDFTGNGGMAALTSGTIRFDRVHVADGTLIYRDRHAGLDERLDHVDADLAAAGLPGPLRLAAKAAYRGLPVTVEGASGAATATGAVPVQLRVGLANAGALRFAGLADGNGALQGDLHVESTNLAQASSVLGRAFGVAPPLLPAVPLTLNATLGTTAQGASGLTALEATLGGSTVTGRVVRPGEGDHKGDRALSANLSVDHADFDAIVAALRALPPGLAGHLPRLLSGKRGLALDLAVDAGRWHGGTIRQARLEARLAGGHVALSRLAATLPGAAEIKVSGGIDAALSGGSSTPSADLQVEGGADDLRATLAWLGIPAKGVPADRLRTLHARFHIAGRPDDFQITGADVRLDQARLTGAVAWVVRNGRPGIGLRATADRLDIDPYLPLLGLDGGALAGRVGDLPGLLGRFDANVDAHVGVLTAAGLVAHAVALKGVLDKGQLTLSNAAVGDLAGIRAAVAGRVGRLAPLGGLDLTAQASAPSSAPGLQMVAGLVPVPLDRLGALTLTARLNGDPARLGVDADLGAAGGRAVVAGTVSDLASTPNYDLKSRVTMPEAGDLLALALPDYQPAGGRLGPFDVYAEVAGSLTGLSLSAIQGTVGGVSVRGDATIDLAQARPRIVANLQTGDLDIDRFLPASSGGAVPVPPFRPELSGTGTVWSSAPLPAGWLKMLDGSLDLTADGLAWQGVRLGQPALRANLSGGTLSLDRLDAGFAGGRLGGSARLTAGPGGLDAAVDGTLVGATLADRTPGFGLSGGHLNVQLDLTAKGDSPAALVRDLAGKASAVLAGTTLRGVDLAAASHALADKSPADVDQAVSQALLAGQTTGLSATGTATVAGGIVDTKDLALAAGNVRLALAGKADLPRWLLDLRGGLQLAAQVPSMPVGVTGPLDHPDRTFSLDPLDAYLAHRAAAAQPANPQPKTPPTSTPKPTNAAPAASPAGIQPTAPPATPSAPPQPAKLQSAKPQPASPQPQPAANPPAVQPAPKAVPAAQAPAPQPPASPAPSPAPAPPPAPTPAAQAAPAAAPAAPATTVPSPPLPGQKPPPPPPNAEDFVDQVLRALTR